MKTTCGGERNMIRSVAVSRQTTGLASGLRAAAFTAAGWMAAVALVNAVELKARTIEAFERYARLTEARMETEISGETPFLWVDRLSEDERDETNATLRAGEVVIRRLETRDEGEKIKVPDGMIHHWIGTILIPGVTLQQTIAMVQDYDRYAKIYDPRVRQSKLLRHEGTQFKVYLQLFMKKVVSVVLNTEYDVEYVHLDDQRVYVPSYTTRLAEVEQPDTPEEREKPEGRDRGFLWRLNNYCSFEERAGDTFMQCESISLSRGIPLLLNVIIRPFVTAIPKESLTFTLEAARRHLTQ